MQANGRDLVPKEHGFEHSGPLLKSSVKFLSETFSEKMHFLPKSFHWKNFSELEIQTLKFRPLNDL